jgi:hypothetical protein
MIMYCILGEQRQVERSEAEIEGWLEVSVLFDVSNNMSDSIKTIFLVQQIYAD